jgi:hypothetical protein
LVAQKNSIEIEEEILEIDEKISRASDTDIRKEYEESRLTLEKRISRVRQINLELDRVDAHMTSVKDTLESTYAEILRIQTLGKESIKLERASLLELLKNQTTQLQHFQIDD